MFDCNQRLFGVSYSLLAQMDAPPRIRYSPSYKHPVKNRAIRPLLRASWPTNGLNWFGNRDLSLPVPK